MLAHFSPHRSNSAPVPSPAAAPVPAFTRRSAPSDYFSFLSSPFPVQPPARPVNDLSRRGAPAFAMAGGGALSLAAHPGRTRWVGRAAILPQWPASPQWLQHVVLAVAFVGMQLVWSCEMAQASPYLLSLGLSKSHMSLVFLAGPVSGLVVQPVVGVWSDDCRSRLGRRRPFILAGSAASALAVLLLGWAPEVAGMVATTGGSSHSALTIWLAILAVYTIDFSINVVQAMDRSLLVDVVPPHLQPVANAWASRANSFGAVFGYWFGGLDLVRLTGGVFGNQQLKVNTLFTAVTMCMCHAITTVCVQERVLIARADDARHEAEGKGVVWSAIHEIWTTLRTLPRPIQQVLNCQFASWIGWFPVLFFSTTWVAQIYAQSTTGNADLSTSSPETVDLATRAGTNAMFYHSLLAFATSILLPPFIAPTTSGPSAGSPFLRPTREPDSPSRWREWWDTVEGWLPKLPIKGFSLAMAWTFSNTWFSVLLLSTYFAKTVTTATIVISLAGFSWAITNWAPFSILGDLILRMTSPVTPSPVPLQQTQWAVPLSPIPEEGTSSLSTVGDSSKHVLDTSPATTPSTAYYDTSSDTPTTREKNSRLLPVSYPADNRPLMYDMRGGGAGESSSSLHDDPYVYDESGEDQTTQMLQVRHSDSLDLGESGGSENETLRAGAGPSIMVHSEEDTSGAEDDWEMEGEDGEGGDQAGIILGCHNLYIVAPQLIVTALSSLIFALFDPSLSVVAGSRTRLLVRQDVEPIEKWDSLGLIFRIGGVAAGVSAVLSWRMSRDRGRRSRGMG